VCESLVVNWLSVPDSATSGFIKELAAELPLWPFWVGALRMRKTEGVSGSWIHGTRMSYKEWDAPGAAQHTQPAGRPLLS
jgi:hypothetical protein